MSLETDVQALTTATTDLLEAVNVSKATLDDKVDDAGAFATASLNSANASAASASTATTQATAASTARTGAETARDAAVVAQNNAVAVVTGGTATLTPQAGKIPLADGLGKIAKGWLTNTDLVEQTDIGTAPNEIPLNQYLGEMAYMDANSIPTIGVATANLATANVTNLQQVTEISTVMPTLNLDFAKVKQLDPRITFTRASTGTYYDGKTRAKAEENLLAYSQEFENVVWSKGTGASVVANNAVAPDGSATADTATFTSGAASEFLRQSVTATAGLTYTISVYARSVSGSTAMSLDLGNAISNGFTLTTSWARYTWTVTPASTYTWLDIQMGGTAVVELWGAQLEQRSTATAYTPTTTQPITNYIPQLMTAASGVPRFEHDPVTGESLGLEIEEQRTNLLLNSASFGAWSANSNTSPISVNNVGVSPDGTTSAWWIPYGATSFNQANYTIPANTATYAWSIYVKALDPTATVTFSTNGINGVNLTGNTTFTFSSLTFTGASNGTVTAVGNGWYRLTQTFTNNGTSTLFVMRVDSGANTNAKVLFWGAQLEAGAFPTSYIPTTTAQVTRAADSASMTGANFSSWYRQDEGTIYIEKNSTVPSNRRYLNIDDGTESNRIQITQANFVLVVGNSAQAAMSASSLGSAKTAGAYKIGSYALSVNGATSVTASTGTIPVVNTLRLGATLTGEENINGTIRKITYYPQRLSNAELVEITA
jgi:hypothetical protein